MKGQLTNWDWWCVMSGKITGLISFSDTLKWEIKLYARLLKNRWESTDSCCSEHNKTKVNLLYPLKAANLLNFSCFLMCSVQFILTCT